MNKYNRIFGIGPTILVMSIIVILLTNLGRNWYTIPFSINQYIQYSLLLVLIALCIAGLVYSVKSLPVQDRGNKLITTGAFSYVRHPLYSSLLLTVPFMLVLLSTDLIFILTGIICIILSHWLLKFEEKHIQDIFGEEYEIYRNKVPMLIPRKFTIKSS